MKLLLAYATGLLSFAALVVVPAPALASTEHPIAGFCNKSFRDENLLEIGACVCASPFGVLGEVADKVIGGLANKPQSSSATTLQPAVAPTLPKPASHPTTHDPNPPSEPVVRPPDANI